MTSKVDLRREEKAFLTLQAQFALVGRELKREFRASDGRISYQVTRRGESRYLGQLHDVKAHLSAIQAHG